jgi:site-specific DNA-cytosine methylase
MLSVRRRTYDRKMPRVPKYRLIDVFAGCGGMTRGFVDTCRFEPVFAVEMDASAARTYGENFGHDHVVEAKIEDVCSFPKADVVIGGPPCQGFSPLNRDGVGLERKSQRRTTSYPSAASSSSTRRSRCLFRSIFSFQKLPD